MATFSTIAEAAQRANENQECPICFESLICKPVANLLDRDNHLICHHLCHLECLQAEENAQCPTCSRNYHSTKIVPSLHPDPQVWFGHMDTDKDGFLSHEEMTEGLKGQLDLDGQRSKSMSTRSGFAGIKTGMGKSPLPNFAMQTMV
jgi:hypothetical protein